MGEKLTGPNDLSDSQLRAIGRVAAILHGIVGIQAAHQAAIIDAAKALSIVGQMLPATEKSADLEKAIGAMLDSLTASGKSLQSIVDEVGRGK